MTKLIHDNAIIYSFLDEILNAAVFRSESTTVTLLQSMWVNLGSVMLNKVTQL